MKGSTRSDRPTPAVSIGASNEAPIAGDSRPTEYEASAPAF